MAEDMQKVSEVKVVSKKEGDKRRGRDIYIHKSVSECHKPKLIDKIK